MRNQLPLIADPLLAWFADNQRPLPWRLDRDPYHVWISEIMLQQTRIEAVKKYYARFMEALPDIRSLSECPEEKLLKLWEGLGYYSRARNLKKAAETIMHEYGGEFPDTFETIIRLPGIGEYTAGAIASLCFNERVTAVDGNVLRVISRLTGDSRNVLEPDAKKAIAGELSAALPEEAGTFNEALMELGELVCLPGGAPLCASCPLNKLCVAFRDGLTSELPVRERLMKRKIQEKTVLLIADREGHIAIEKRTQPGLLSGMYQFPNVDGFLADPEIKELLKGWGLTPVSVTFQKDAKHAFTHIDWLMKGWQVQVKRADDRFLWVSPEQLVRSYPFPTAFKPFLSP